MSNQIGGDPPPANAGIDLKKFFESRKKEAIWSRFLSPPPVGDHVWASLRELLCYVGRTCACVREKGVSEVVVKACFFFGSISVFARLRFKLSKFESHES